MSWIYHDAALEGVVYTQQELMAALYPGALAAEASMMPVVLEVRNHKAVCDYIREEATAARRGADHADAHQADARSLHRQHAGGAGGARGHRAARAHREGAGQGERAGGFRKDMPLHRTYFHDIAQPAKIQPALEKLVDYTASAEFREFHPIKQAATVQHMFLQIFPFTEHSGKVGRMCTNLILLRNGYMPAVIHSIDRQKYYESFRGPVAGFRTLLMDAIENSLDNGVKYFKDLSRRYKAIN